MRHNWDAFRFQLFFTWVLIRDSWRKVSGAIQRGYRVLMDLLPWIHKVSRCIVQIRGRRILRRFSWHVFWRGNKFLKLILLALCACWIERLFLFELLIRCHSTPIVAATERASTSLLSHLQAIVLFVFKNERRGYFRILRRNLLSISTYLKLKGQSCSRGKLLSLNCLHWGDRSFGLKIDSRSLGFRLLLHGIINWT